MKNRIALLSLLSVLTLPGLALAQLTEKDATNAIRDRQAIFRLIAHNNRLLGETVRGTREFDVDVLIKGSQRIAMLASMIPEMFEADTRAHPELETRASTLIWDGKDNFLDIATGLEEGANKAVEILQTQGQNGLRQAADEIARNCSTCHDTYRLPAL
jgi:cytochrome c556